MADACIFCRIVQGEIPSATVFENRDVLVFLDINPIHPGHTLVVLKRHVATLDQCTPEDMQSLARVLPRLAAAVVKATGAAAYNVLNNNGRCAGQLVEHLHFHIIPRRPDDGLFDRWPAGKYPPGVMDSLAEKIIGVLSAS